MYDYHHYADDSWKASSRFLRERTAGIRCTQATILVIKIFQLSGYFVKAKTCFRTGSLFHEFFDKAGQKNALVLFMTIT